MEREFLREPACAVLDCRGTTMVISRVTSKKDIELVAVGPRVRIYEDTYRIIRKQS